MTRWLSSVGRSGILLVSSIAYFPSTLCRRTTRADFMAQMYATGIRTLPVVTVVALFMGMILALQVGLELRRFNYEIYLGAAVMMTLIREMAPFCCGLCLAACVGSAIAAELGTMKVNEEIDALEIMSISPVRFLVAPRMLALLLMAPVLCFYSCVIGTLGGGIVASTQLAVNFPQYMNSALSMATEKDLFTGLLKAAVFGLTVGTVSAHEGFGSRMGATGVGRATQRSVIINFLLVLILGYIITRVFYR